MIDTCKQFQLQTGVFLKRPDVATFDDYLNSEVDYKGCYGCHYGKNGLNAHPSLSINNEEKNDK